MPDLAPVIVVGEALVDIAPEPSGADADGLAMRARAGGSPANVAVGLARLGIRARFAGRLSRDAFGALLRAHLEAGGVDVTLCVPAEQPTTLAIVGLDATGAASYSFYVEGTADWQWDAAELPTAARGHAIHTGSLAIGLEPGADVIAAWLSEQRSKRDAFVSLDPNVRPALVLDRPGYRERLDRLIALAQLVKVSDEDLRALEPAAEPLETARDWAGRGPELIVVTHGAGGATAVRAGDEPLRRRAQPVAVIDTVGAGDAFTAGLLTYLAEREALRAGRCAALDREALDEALDFAGRVAAITCTRAGADPPWRGELAVRQAAGKE